MPDLPDWTPIEAATPSLPGAGGEGRVVAVLATRNAIAQGWAASSAMDLARGWSQEGRRVMLVDGGLDFPSLHTVAGLRNREGVTDATFHGASIARVSRPIQEGALYLVTAGAPVGDPAEVPRSPRWHRLLAGMTQAGATVALFVRDGDPATTAFLGAASDIVVLAAPEDDPPEAARDLEAIVRSVTGRSGSLSQPLAAPQMPLVATVGESDGPGWMVWLIVLAAVAAAAAGLVMMSGR